LLPGQPAAGDRCDPGYIGCIVIRPDGSRRVAQVMPDPLT
jgi:hypothetical protein